MLDKDQNNNKEAISDKANSNNRKHAFIKEPTKKVDSVETIAGKVSLINQEKENVLATSRHREFKDYREEIKQLLIERHLSFDNMANLRAKNNGSINEECENCLQEIKNIDAKLLSSARGMYSEYAGEDDKARSQEIIDIARCLLINVCIQVDDVYKEGVKPKILRDYSDSNEISMEKFYDLTQIPSDVLYATVNQIGTGTEEKITVEALTLDNGRQVMTTRTIDLQSTRAYILSELNIRRLTL